MRKLCLYSASILFLGYAAASTAHSHIAHSCPKRPGVVHQCTHNGRGPTIVQWSLPVAEDPLPDCIPGQDCGEGLDGCTCTFTCIFNWVPKLFGR